MPRPQKDASQVLEYVAIHRSVWLLGRVFWLGVLGVLGHHGAEAPKTCLGKGTKSR